MHKNCFAKMQKNLTGKICKIGDRKNEICWTCLDQTTINSYNRKLLEFIRRNFKFKFELEVLEIDEVPMFNQDEKWDESFQLRFLYNKITRADGVIIATPEHNHTISASLKSVLEWLSYEVHPFENKPVMIVGASYYDQGTSRAQVHLRKILDAPGVNAYTLPGNEFLLGKAKEAFDNNGNITNEGTVKFLETCLDNFVKYVGVVSKLKKPKPIEPEDLDCGNQLLQPSQKLILTIQNG